MSLLDIADGRPNMRAMKIERLKRAPKQMFEQVLSGWQQGISAIWDDENPQGVLDDLGSDVLELFQRSSQLAAFLESQKPGCTASHAAKVKDFTIVNGRVLITV